MEQKNTDCLCVRDLSVDFKTSHGIVHAVRKMNLQVERVQIASLNGHLCHIRRTARDIISGQERTH